MRQPTVSKTSVWKAVVLGVGISLAMLSSPVHAAPASGGETVQGLYEALLITACQEIQAKRPAMRDPRLQVDN